MVEQWDDKTPTRLSDWDISNDSVTLTDVEWPKPSSQPEPVKQALNHAEMMYYVMYKGMKIEDVVKYSSVLKEKLNGRLAE